LNSWNARVAAVLGVPEHTGTWELIGEGESSVCFGVGDEALLLTRASGSRALEGLRMQQWCATQALNAGVSAVRFLAVEDHPWPHARLLRIEGISGDEALRRKELTGRELAFWLGGQAKRINTLPLRGFGQLVADPDYPGTYRGRRASLRDEIDRLQHVTLTAQGPLAPDNERRRRAILDTGLINEADLALISDKLTELAARTQAAVLCHNDLRGANIIVPPTGEMVLTDWGLASAGLGIGQELVKTFDGEPYTLANPRVQAFCDGYGIPAADRPKVLDEALLMLLVSGLEMCHDWIDCPRRREGVRGWLSTVRKVTDTWRRA
jgi:hypothetical protein